MVAAHIPLKRKVGYDIEQNEGVESTRKKFHKMFIDGASNGGDTCATN